MAGPKNEFDGGDDEDEEINLYQAPQRAPRQKKGKKDGLVVDDENFPGLK